MEIAKLYEDEIFKIEKHMYNTEKAICYVLDQSGLKLGDDFEFFKEIDNIVTLYIPRSVRLIGDFVFGPGGGKIVIMG